MFYKYHYLPKETEKDFYDDFSREFTLALYEKTKSYPGFSLANIHFVNKEQKLAVLLYQYKEQVQCWTVKGVRDGDFSKRQPFWVRLENSEVFIEKVSIEKLNEQPINQEKYNEAKQLLEDFFIPKVSSEVKDKEGNAYQLKITHNADPTIGSYLVIDKLTLIKDNQEIGHLKVKYTTDEIAKKMIIEDKTNFETFLNTATIDFSWLNENFRNKGLGYVMYIEMAKYLNQQNIKFRSSTIQSSHAQNLWQGIYTHFEKNIMNANVANNKVAFLEISKDAILIFEENKPKLVSKTNLKKP